MKRLSYPNYISRSGASFETTENFIKSTVVVDSTSPRVSETGLPLTQIRGTVFATTRDELHTFVIGDSGCGKTRRVILPAIRMLAKSGRSLVISDPKGEIYKKTSDSLRKHGYDVHIINFRNPSCGDRWNPLALIEDFYKSSDQEKRERAENMIKDIADILVETVSSDDDKYWENAAKAVFLGVALLIMEYGNPGDLTFENISIVSQQLRDELNSKGSNPRLSSKKTNSLYDFIKNLPKTSPIVKNLDSCLSAPEKTLGSIFSVYNAMINEYVSQESILNLLSDSDIDVTSLGKKPTALFIVLPDDSTAMYAIATIFVKQIYSTLVNLADENLNGILNNKVSFILDEFANFAPIPSVDAMLTAARSRGMTFTLVCQSMEQLFMKYDKGAEVLLANCRVWVYMSCRNLPFLQRLESLLGNYTSPYTGEKEPLIDISELQHFQMGQVLVLNDRCKPMMGFLPDYSEYNFGDEDTCIVVDIPEKREQTTRQIIDVNSIISANGVPADSTTSTGSSTTFGGPDFDALFDSVIKQTRPQTPTPPSTAPQESTTSSGSGADSALLAELEELAKRLESLPDDES